MAEFEVNGTLYRSGKLDAMTQFNLTRRMLPLMPAVKNLAMLWGARQKEEEAEASKADDAIALEPNATFDDAMEAAATAIAKLSDEDSNFIIATCLGVVSRKSGAGFSPVWNKPAGRPMFDDINMADMLKIMFAVLQSEFAAFFPSSGRISDQQPTR